MRKCAFPAVTSSAIAAAALCGLGVAGCSDDSDSTTTSSGELDVELTDAPFPTGVVVSAEIDVERVEAQIAASGAPTTGGGPPPSGGPPSPFVRVDDFTSPATFDLLQLTNGVTDTLVAAQVPTGRVTHLRLFFAAARVELSDGRVLDLTIPSGAQTGLKVPLTPPPEVVSGFSTDLLLDIDTSRSFVPEGDPTLAGDPGAFDDPSEITSMKFNPVARAVNESTVGRISGTVHDGQGTTDPADDAPLGGATVRVIQSGTEITATVAAADGTYTVLGLDAGTYTVEVEAAGFTTATEPASVTAGSVTSVDVVLQP